LNTPLVKGKGVTAKLSTPLVKSKGGNQYAKCCTEPLVKAAKLTNSDHITNAIGDVDGIDDILASTSSFDMEAACRAGDVVEDNCMPATN